MKANFDIKKINASKNSNDLKNNDIKNNDVDYDEYLKTLPKGWNLWSMRNQSNKL